MKKNDIIKLHIDSYGDGGEGVARVDGLAVFVPFAMVGEEVEAKIILLKKSYAVAKLMNVLTPSKCRVTPDCEHFTKCGGCQLQHMDRIAQSGFKKQKVADCLKRIAFIDMEIGDTVTGAKQTRYRNKLQLPLAQKEQLVGGFFAPFSHRIIEIDDCIIQEEISMDVVKAVKTYAIKAHVLGYDEIKHRGLLRHIVTRSNANGMLITIVINGKTLPQPQMLVAELDKLNINYGLYININTEVTNVVTSNKFIHIHGMKELEQNDGEITYSVLPQSFLQVNEEIKEQIYSDALLNGKITEQDTVVNAYSGAGLLTAHFAQKAKHAYGVEIIKEATIAADNLAERNNLTDKMTNITGDCAVELATLIPKLERENQADNGNVVFVLDPPRKGVDTSILQKLLQLKPSKIIYISCNPASLARDIGVLTGTLQITEKGLQKNEYITTALTPSSLQNNVYVPTTVTPYDMFPHTKHVETLAVLELMK